MKVFNTLLACASAGLTDQRGDNGVSMDMAPDVDGEFLRPYHPDFNLDLVANDRPEQPNMQFVFHNKLPKSGSTTMKYIAKLLSKQNDFTMDYRAPCIFMDGCAHNPDDGVGGEKNLVAAVAQAREEAGGKYFLMKHQYMVNFTKFDYDQPTMINIVRDPVTRFASKYYFQRYGFMDMGSDARKGESRHVWMGTADEVDQTLDECVERRSDECIEQVQVMVRYFCGTAPECSMKSETMGKFGLKNDWNAVARAAEIARYNIINNYHAIGLLENFDKTLELFEKMMPTFFKGAKDAYYSDYVQTKKSKSKTSVKKGYSNSTREFLLDGPLRYEWDLYQLIKSIFNKRLSVYGLDFVYV